MKRPVIAAPEHKLYVGGLFTPGRRWSVSTGVQYIDGLYTSVGDRPTTESFVLWNVRAAFSATKWLDVWARGENLLAQKYEINAGYPMPRATVVGGTIVECNTAYGGGRGDTESHRKAAEAHGFTAIAPVDIMDADGEVELPLEGGKHLTKDIVGKNFLNYDFVVVLSHFKGHAMGGFGGAIKNMSIGIASSNGKRYIHSAGTSTADWGHPEQDDFLESMAEAAKAVANHCGDRILYISVANNLSVDCDCDSHLFLHAHRGV